MLDDCWQQNVINRPVLPHRASSFLNWLKQKISVRQSCGALRVVLQCASCVKNLPLWKLLLCKGSSCEKAVPYRKPFSQAYCVSTDSPCVAARERTVMSHALFEFPTQVCTWIMSRSGKKKLALLPELLEAEQCLVFIIWSQGLEHGSCKHVASKKACSSTHLIDQKSVGHIAFVFCLLQICFSFLLELE